MKGQRIKINNSMKTKSIILSVVSIIELIVLLATMTFAWFEGITSLEIKGENLSTAGGLKSKFIVGEGTDYDDTAELNEFFHKQSFDKLSPVSSLDGDNFYAITTGSAPTSQAEYITAANNSSVTFRKLSDEEKLSSILYFQFELSSVSTDTDFWFKSQPSISINGTELNAENNPFRISIDDGSGAAANKEGNYIFTTRTKQPSNNQYIRAVSAIDTNGKATLTSTSNVITTLADPYVFGTEANNDGEHRIFTVQKGQTKIITIAMWIEAFDPAYNESIIPPGASVQINLEFCSSWDVVDEMVFRDFTADQWVDATAEDQNNKAMKLGAINLDTNYYYPFTYVYADKEWTAKVPRAVQEIEFVWQGLNDVSHKDSAWNQKDNPRGSEKVFTVFGSNSETGMWYDGGVDHITFSDYTSDHWVNDINPKMRVNVTYNGIQMSYSMTDAPTQDSAGKNTWSMYIPSDVNAVVFNRCDRSDTTTAINTWDGPNRNGNTRYYALDGGEVEVIEGTAIYLTIPKDKYNNGYNFGPKHLPALTFTSRYNQTVVNKYGVSASDYSNTLYSMNKSEYITQAVPGAEADTWPTNRSPIGEMEILSETTQKITFVYYIDYELDDNTYITFWSRSHANKNGTFNNIGNDVSIFPVIYKNGKNNFAIMEFTKFKDSAYNNGCYAVTGYQTATYSGSDGNVVKPGKEQHGQWGAPDLPAGTYQTWFVHPDTTATSVTATFEYYGVEHTIDLGQTPSDKRKWFTTITAIPDDVTQVRFQDNNGNVWTVDKATGTRTKSTNYFYATSNTTGKWSAHFTPPSGEYTTYFVPPSGNTATSVTITYTYSDVTFTTSITAKDSNGYFSTQAIPDSATNIIIKDSAGHTWTTGTGRTSTNCYFMATSNTAGAWSKPATPTKTIYLITNDNWEKDNAWFWVHAWGGVDGNVDVKMTAVSGQTNLYSVEIPEDSTQIIFCRMNPAYSDISWNTGLWNKTVDLTIPSDSDTFTITSSTNGTWHEVEEPEPDPTTRTLYLKPNSNWTQKSAWFAVYAWKGSGGSGNETWIKMTDTDGDGIYQADVPLEYTKVIFCRMNPSSSSLGWGSKWDQTNDLTIPTNGNNLYTVKEGTWNKGGGSWSTK